MIFTTLLLAISSVLSLPTSKHYSHAEKAGTIVPDHYIVVFHDWITPEQIKKHWDWLHAKVSPALDALHIQSEDFHTQSFLDNFDILHHYDFDNFKAYAAKLPNFIVNLLSVLPEIAHIEPDRVMTIFGEQANPGSWGISRISTRDLPISKSYSYPDSAGFGVDAYVIDTGIFIKHPEFQGRAIWGKSFTRDGDVDGNGHGTHVAGTIGSKTYGVAKNVTLIAVKVLDAQGSGSTSSVIGGIDYVAKEAKRKGKKSLANMSLGGGASIALDKAVKAAIKAGVVFAIAAGNSGKDACNLSPARVPEAVTVAASDRTDALAYFSERGPCVDIIAPGVDITSTWNNGKINTISGTSMATPHVAGVIALALAEKDFSSVEEVHDYIKYVSTKNHITGALNSAPNNFLYNNVLKGGFPDNEPKEPTPEPGEPGEPDEPGDKECPFPQCLIDPECTKCCIDCWLWSK